MTICPPLLAPLVEPKCYKLTLLAINKDREIVPPRTKKNSAVLVRGLKHPILLPSDAFREWEKALKRTLIAGGICAKPQDPDAKQLKWLLAPAINYPVFCSALIYRDADVGDATGFYDAIADALQSCGIVTNDRYIRHWDGSRLLKDPKRPRVEVTLTEVRE